MENDPRKILHMGSTIYFYGIPKIYMKQSKTSYLRDFRVRSIMPVGGAVLQHICRSVKMYISIKSTSFYVVFKYCRERQLMAATLVFYDTSNGKTNRGKRFLLQHMHKQLTGIVLLFILHPVPSQKCPVSAKPQ